VADIVGESPFTEWSERLQEETQSASSRIVTNGLFSLHHGFQTAHTNLSMENTFQKVLTDLEPMPNIDVSPFEFSSGGKK
jgi:hypothetical protein